MQRWCVAVLALSSVFSSGLSYCVSGYTSYPFSNLGSTVVVQSAPTFVTTNPVTVQSGPSTVIGSPNYGCNYCNYCNDGCNYCNTGYNSCNNGYTLYSVGGLGSTSISSSIVNVSPSPAVYSSSPCTGCCSYQSFSLNGGSTLVY